MAKSRDAFRTISEVSAALDTPTHVLRFWESKFSQIKPVKRAGGRRYYRPDDIALLSGIKTLLHEQGMTIKGAQKLLREQGIKHVMALARPELHPEQDPPVPETPDPETEVMSNPIPTENTVDSVVDMVSPNGEPTASAPPAPAPAPASDATSQVVAVPAHASAATAPPRPALLTALASCNSDKLRGRAAQIAPLVTRLETLRDRMRGY